jgi:hypothetical protein
MSFENINPDVFKERLELAIQLEKFFSKSSISDINLIPISTADGKKYIDDLKSLKEILTKIQELGSKDGHKSISAFALGLTKANKAALNSFNFKNFKSILEDQKKPLERDTETEEYFPGLYQMSETELEFQKIREIMVEEISQVTSIIESGGVVDKDLDESFRKQMNKLKIEQEKAKKDAERESKEFKDYEKKAHSMVLAGELQRGKTRLKRTIPNERPKFEENLLTQIEKGVKLKHVENLASKSKTIKKDSFIEEIAAKAMARIEKNGNPHVEITIETLAPLLTAAKSKRDELEKPGGRLDPKKLKEEEQQMVKQSGFKKAVIASLDTKSRHEIKAALKSPFYDIESKIDNLLVIYQKHLSKKASKDELLNSLTELTISYSALTPSAQKQYSLIYKELCEVTNQICAQSIKVDEFYNALEVLLLAVKEKRPEREINSAAVSLAIAYHALPQKFDGQDLLFSSVLAQVGINSKAVISTVIQSAADVKVQTLHAEKVRPPKKSFFEWLCEVIVKCIETWNGKAINSEDIKNLAKGNAKISNAIESNEIQKIKVQVDEEIANFKKKLMPNKSLVDSTNDPKTFILDDQSLSKLTKYKLIHEYIAQFSVKHGSATITEKDSLGNAFHLVDYYLRENKVDRKEQIDHLAALNRSCIKAGLDKLSSIEQAVVNSQQNKALGIAR